MWQMTLVSDKLQLLIPENVSKSITNRRHQQNPLREWNFNRKELTASSFPKGSVLNSTPSVTPRLYPSNFSCMCHKFGGDSSRHQYGFLLHFNSTVKWCRERHQNWYWQCIDRCKHRDDFDRIRIFDLRTTYGSIRKEALGNVNMWPIHHCLVNDSICQKHFDDLHS